MAASASRSSSSAVTSRRAVGDARCRCSRRRSAGGRRARTARLISSATPVGDPAHVGRGSSIALEQDHELVAAEAGDRVAGPQRPRSRRSAAATSSSSPARWPSESLMTLKSSMSANRTASRASASRRRSSASASVRSNSARFGRPVSGSWWAWWSSRSASLLAGGDVDALGDVVVRAAVGVADQRVAPEEPAEAAVGAHVALLDLRAVGLGRPARLERGAVGDRGEVPEVLGARCPARSRSSSLVCSSVAVGRDERHRDRRGVERAPEALLGVRGRGAGATRWRARRQVGDRERGDEQAVDAGPAPRRGACGGRRRRSPRRRSRRAGARRTRSPAGTPTTPRRARARRPSRSSGSAPRSCRARRRRPAPSTTAAPSRTSRSASRAQSRGQQASAPKIAGTMSNAQPAASDQPWLTANAGSSTRCAARTSSSPR